MDTTRPSRAFDRWIAEHVFHQVRPVDYQYVDSDDDWQKGHEEYFPDSRTYVVQTLHWPKYYTSNLVAAWEIVNEFIARGYDYHNGYYNKGSWYAMFSDSVGPVGWTVGHGSTAPLAICQIVYLIHERKEVT